MITLERAIAEKLPEDLIAMMRTHGDIDAIRDIKTAVIVIYADGFTEIRNKTGGTNERA